MAEYLQSCLFWRVLQAIGGFFAEMNRGSAVFRWLAACWNASGTKAFILRRLSAPMRPTQEALATKKLQRLNDRLAHRRGLMDCVKDCVLYKIYRAIFTCGRGSKILGYLFRHGQTALILFVVGIYVLVHYTMRSILSVPVLSSSWDELLMITALLWIFRCRLDQKSPVQTRANPLDLPVLLFITVGFLLMNLISPYPSIQLLGYRATAEYLVWFFLITRLLRDDEDFMELYVVLVASATLIALHGIYQYIVKVPMPSNWVAHAETAVRTRVYSVFGSPNIMGDFMVIFVPMSAALAYYWKDTRLKLLAWLCAALMCAACLFTMSRGAWVGMAAAIFLFIILVDGRLLWLVLAGGIVLSFVPFVTTRIGFLFTDEFVSANTNGGRAGRWANGLHYLETSNPALGFGLGMFGGAVAMQNQVLDGVDYFYMDNYYLKILVEMGYVGLCSFVLMVLGFLANGLRALYRTKQNFKNKLDRFYPLCAGMFCGLVGVLVHCFFENIFEEPYMMVYFWSIAGMIVWLGFLRRPAEKKEAA
jgi:O-antigen ligase